MSRRRVFARQQALPRFFDERELDRLLAAVPAGNHPLLIRDRSLLETLIATGLRASELLALQVVDIRGEVLFVRRGKGGRPRYVPLSQRAQAALRRVIPAGAGPDEPVFRNAWGQKLSRRGLHLLVTGYIRAAGLEGTLHSTRHSAATRWLNRGLNLRAVQACLGHADISTTAVYLGVALDSLCRDFQAAMGDA